LPAGASLYVDGRPSGKLPVSDLEVPAGKHALGVAARGRVPWAEEVDVGRGATTSLDLALSPTLQRRSVAWAGAATLVVAAMTAVAGGLWYQADHAAADLDAQRRTAGITVDQLAEYNGDRARRDQWRTGTFVAAGVTGALALVTLGLYLFDFQEPPRLAPSGSGAATALAEGRIAF
jgi:hypothetical protein